MKDGFNHKEIEAILREELGDAKYETVAAEVASKIDNDIRQNSVLYRAMGTAVDIVLAKMIKENPIRAVEEKKRLIDLGIYPTTQEERDEKSWIAYS